MKKFDSEKGIPMLSRVGVVLAVLLGALMVAGTGCDTGNEGDRCNPDLSHDECGDGLMCTQPAFCSETYCCPANVTSSDNPYCQPGCAGGAAAICAATPTSPACAFVACTADASLTTCAALASEDGGATSDDGSGGEAGTGGAEGGSLPETGVDSAAETSAPVESGADVTSTDAPSDTGSTPDGGGDAADSGGAG